MIIFLDTEFTDLVVEPRLLSIGMVATAGIDCEFYAEVTDRDRIHAACGFALHVVLPQFGKVAHASCSYASLAARLRVFMDRAVTSLGPGEAVEIAFTCDLDWALVRRAIHDAGAMPGDRIWDVLRPRNVFDTTGRGSGRLASETYFSRQAEAPIARHHALCDARALRAAYQAGVGQSDTAPVAGHSPLASVIGPARPCDGNRASRCST